MSRSPKVLIVGAGPTGLMLANALARYGVAFDIVDRSPGPSPQSKALAINALSRFSFDLLGIDDIVGHAACPLQRLNVYWNGRRLNAIDFRRLPLGALSLRAQPQSRTEQDLVDALSQAGRQVTWGCRLTDVDASRPGAVRVRFDTSAGLATDGAYSFVVGCDGKQSFVRAAAKITCQGYEYPFHLLLADVRLQWTPRQTGAHYFVYQDGFFILVPIGRDAFRVVVKRDGSVSEGLGDPREIGDELRRRLGRDILDGEPTWFSRARLYMRIADRLRCGRIFLAGDSAHLYSPIGGTGMNTGVQDAINLGWKLAYTLRGHTRSESLLDSYEAERLPVIRETAAITDASTRAIGRLSTDLRLVTPFVPSMSKRRLLKELAVRHSGLAQRYGLSSAIHAESLVAPFAGGLARAGEPFLALPAIARALATVTGVPSRADAIHIVILEPAAPHLADATAAVYVTCKVERTYGAYARPVIVSSRGEASASARCPVIASSLLPMPPSFSALTESMAIVVRPDGVVALVQPAKRATLLLDFLAQLLETRLVASDFGTVRATSARGRGEAPDSSVDT